MESSGNTRDDQISHSLNPTPTRPTIESCTTDYDIYTTEAVSSQDELEESSRNYQSNNNQSQSRGTILTDSDNDSTADEGASLISPSQKKKNKRKNNKNSNSSRNEQQRGDSRINTVRSKILVWLRNLVIFEVFGVETFLKKRFFGRQFHSKSLENDQIEGVGPKFERTVQKMLVLARGVMSIVGEEGQG